MALTGQSIHVNLMMPCRFVDELIPDALVKNLAFTNAASVMKWSLTSDE
jgi:hypothetical protein